MEHDEPFDLEAAWAALQHAVAMMLAIFAGAAAVAERLILPRAARAEILQWLAPLEAVARRLILIEALKLPPPNEPPPSAPRGKVVTAYADKPPPELPQDPDRWTIRFHVWRGAAAGKPNGAGQGLRGDPIRHNALPLARRMEALRRLADQRQAYARRLSRRVHNAPARAREVFAPYRHPATAVKTLLRQVQQEAETALSALNTS